MRRSLIAILGVLSLIPLSVAAAAIVGLGVSRGAPVGAVALATIGVVVLPCVGIGGLTAKRGAGLVAGALVWPALLLAGLPAYFPGERQEAISTGLGFLAVPWGTETSLRAAALGDALGALLGEEPPLGRPPPVAAEPVEEPADAVAAVADDTPDAPPALFEGGGADEIALPYEGEGRSLRIPVTFEQGGGSAEIWMIFDTGATYTTLTTASLRELGVKVPADAPEITLNTANGQRSAHLVLLDRVWLGGFQVEGVTVAVCDECATDDSAGLLGLNVTGNFTVTMDPGRRELVLKPRDGEQDRKLDVQHWVDIAATATAWSDGRVLVEVTADSRASRPIRDVVVGIHCAGDDFRATLRELPPHDGAAEEVRLPRGVDCSAYRISLDGGRW